MWNMMLKLLLGTIDEKTHLGLFLTLLSTLLNAYTDLGGSWNH